jgi:hypothetical protein
MRWVLDFDPELGPGLLRTKSSGRIHLVTVAIRTFVPFEPSTTRSEALVQHALTNGAS